MRTFVTDGTGWDGRDGTEAILKDQTLLVQKVYVWKNLTLRIFSTFFGPTLWSFKIPSVRLSVSLSVSL